VGAWLAGAGLGLAATMGSSGGLAGTFLGPLALLFGMIGLLVTTVVLFMRSSILFQDSPIQKRRRSAYHPSMSSTPAT
jgi:hypothetical protein